MRTTAFECVSEELLMTVAGGQSSPPYDPNNNALGRVGPGTGWKWLGNHYTPEAYEHDKAVRDAKAGGASGFQAHMGALPKLPAAIGSWFRAKLNPGAQDRQY
jgi:hypothetical protein